MTIGFLFWLLMILALIFSFACNWNGGALGRFGPWGNSLLVFVLFLLLGIKVFGWPIRG